MTPEIEVALNSIEMEKAGFLPPFLSNDELAELLEAWERIYTLPDLKGWNKRFIIDPRIYEESAFAKLATHPVIQETARRVIGDFQLAGYAVVATTRNGDEPTTPKTVPFHNDHCVYSDVEVSQARDTFVCIWVNFEELAMENGPFCLAVGTDKLNLDRNHFTGKDRVEQIMALGWDKLARFNTGPAGSTAVYSGKTWHSATVNCSDRVRKGLNMNFVPRRPLDSLKRNPFDLCALSEERYQSLRNMIGNADYIIDRDEQLARKVREEGIDHL